MPSYFALVADGGHIDYEDLRAVTSEQQTLRGGYAALLKSRKISNVLSTVRRDAKRLKVAALTD